ncbi:MAG TPA: Ig-like domain-containing protein [Verrucomicrobiae bacterium]|nr:Ig-like domain-containing protein [Verrucomicrobiae bacterium]
MKMKLLSKRVAISFAAGLLTLCGLSSGFAATTNVIVGPGGSHTFSPANVTIHVGDSVIWTWASTFHSTTSGTVSGGTAHPDGLWDSGLIQNLPHAFTNTFNSAGDFPYYCSVHYGSGMIGDVAVEAASQPVSVAITNPAAGAVFSAPATVSLRASVTKGSGSVTNVEFLVNTTVLASKTTAPFFATASNLMAGSYSLSAIASDDAGLKATNSVSISVVMPLTVALTNLALISGTNFQFSYLVNTGLSYVVQRSTDLASPANWVSLATNMALSNPAVFMDIHATNNPGFYRVGRMPNP